MIVRLAHLGGYLAMKIETSRGSAILKRWPWPYNRSGRSKHLRNAVRYGEDLARILECPFDLSESLHEPTNVPQGSMNKALYKEKQL